MAEEKLVENETEKILETIEGIEITHRFRSSEDHKSFMTNRIWGGLQTGNLFQLNFMLEHKPIPEMVTERINKDGTLTEVKREGSQDFIRENQATVYMSLETLLSFHQWLKRKVDDLRHIGVIPKEEGE